MALILAMIAVAACQAPTPALAPRTESSMPDTTTLPDPPSDGSVSLEEALRLRRSVRDFDDRALTEAEISSLLWAAQGITDPRGYRAAPSAGALYPLELYLLTSEGLFHYLPNEHALQRLGESDLRRPLYEAALQQEFILEAPATIVFTAVQSRTEARYGPSRSPRYIHMEVGHAAQNLLLQAAALGLGAVPVGAFNDDRVQAVLGLPADHEPLYLVPVGHPP